MRVHYTDAPFCADDGSQRQLVGVEKNEANVRVVCRVRADPVDDRMQFEWLVWPGPVSDLHPQRSAATGSYVTAALPSPRNNDTASSLAVGELVLPAMTVAEAAQYADRAASSKRPAALDTVSCRATNAVGRQQSPCLYHIIPACEYGRRHARARPDKPFIVPVGCDRYSADFTSATKAQNTFFWK